MSSPTQQEFDKREKEISKFRKDEISKFGFQKYTQIELLFKLGECILFDDSQNFIFNLSKGNRRFRKILEFIEDMGKKLNNNPVIQNPFDISINPILNIIDSNQHYCQEISEEFNCLFPEQIVDIITQVLYFYLTFPFYQIKEPGRPSRPFFGKGDGSNLSLAGQLFRAFIILIIRFDHYVFSIDHNINNLMSIKKEKTQKYSPYTGDLKREQGKHEYEDIEEEIQKLKNIKVKLLNRLELMSELIFEKFVYNISNYEDFLVFFQEFIEMDNKDKIYFDFVFPINYSNYPILALLCILKINHINFNPIEKLLQISMYQIWKIYNMSIPKLEFALKEIILLTNHQTLNNIAPLQYAIINSNVEAVKLLVEITNIPISNTMVTADINNYKGYSYINDEMDSDNPLVVVDSEITSLFIKSTISFQLNTDNSILAKNIEIALRNNKTLFNPLNIHLFHLFVNKTPNLISNENPQYSVEILSKYIIKEDIENNKTILQLLQSSQASSLSSKLNKYSDISQNIITQLDSISGRVDVDQIKRLIKQISSFDKLQELLIIINNYKSKGLIEQEIGEQLDQNIKQIISDSTPSIVPLKSATVQQPLLPQYLQGAQQPPSPQYLQGAQHLYAYVGHSGLPQQHGGDRRKSKRKKIQLEKKYQEKLKKISNKNKKKSYRNDKLIK